ncbi:MAG: group I intron-associated PD-(D/E)XK endonuclease [Sterolibacterium sp.]|nr:group I intron-associated PD-(D/E)XK endonuclease [Sterolibacterium sp.]
MKGITDLAAGTAAEHLVAADLLLKGYNAFLADQCCAYDVAVDIQGRLVRLQVKSTRTPRPIPNNPNARPAYMWYVRRAGKGGARVYQADAFDMLALVALDTRQIAYLPPSMQVQTVHIRTHEDDAPPAHGGKSGKTFSQFTFDKAVAEVIA